MAKRRSTKSETIHCVYFVWRLYIRNGTYWIDGRSNRTNMGRRSLGVTSREDALRELHQIDELMAVKRGLRSASSTATSETPIGIKEGSADYLKHCGRSEIVGGIAKSTLRRYTPILDNFGRYAERTHLSAWNEVTNKTVEDYVSELETAERAPGTIALEVTVIKQTFKHLAEHELIPKTSRLKVTVRRPRETTRYCWTAQEVTAMVNYCNANPELTWMRAIIIGLTCTGLRISELLGLRWTDINLNEGMVCLTDERMRRTTSKKLRRIKNRTSRSFPINADLRNLLERTLRTQSNLVFLSADGRPLEYHFVRNKFVDLVVTPLAAQFPPVEGHDGFVNGRLHSFRHYFCSACANSGVSENAVMRWLGHSDSAMVRHYYHLHNDEAQRQMGNVRFLNVS